MQDNKNETASDKHNRKNFYDAINAITSGIAKSIDFVIKEIVRVACLIIWLVVGFFLWVPLLIRCILLFSFTVSLSIMRPKTDVRNSERALAFSMTFFTIGFVKINHTISQTKEFDAEYEEIDAKLLWAFFKEIVFAGFTWLALSLVSGIINPNWTAFGENITLYYHQLLNWVQGI